MDARDTTQKFLAWGPIALAQLIAVTTPLVAAATLIDGDALSVSDVIAVGAGWMTVSLGLMIGGATLSPKRQISRRQGALSALNVLSCGVTLLIPPLASPALAPGVLFGLLVLTTALTYLTSWLLLNDLDEMQRRIVADASVAGFHIVWTGLLLYAGAAALGLQVGLDLWALVSLLTLAVILISCFVGMRRQPPLPEE